MGIAVPIHCIVVVVLVVWVLVSSADEQHYTIALYSIRKDAIDLLLDQTVCYFA